MPTPLLKETLKHIHMDKSYVNVPNNKEFHYMHNITNIQLHVNKDPISLALNIKKIVHYSMFHKLFPCPRPSFHNKPLCS